MLNSKSKLPIGIDISDLAIKTAQIFKKSDQNFIQALNRVTQNEGVMTNGVISNEDELIKNIKRATSETLYGSFTGKDAVICLPETKTFVKLISLEKDINDIGNIIMSEIEHYIPYSINDIYYDWQIINHDEANTYVLVGASPKSIVDDYIRIFSQTDINVIALEIEPQAIARCLLAEEMHKIRNNNKFAYGVIDIGAKRTNMFIYSDYTIVNSVSLPISGENTTEKIAATLEITKSQAEKAKLICGLDQDKAQGIIKDILEEMVKDLNKKIGDVINFYKLHYPNFPDLEKIIICGGGAYIKDIEKNITEKYGIKTEMGNVLTNIIDEQNSLNKVFIETHNFNLTDNQQNNMSVKQDLSLKFATAIGLALRGALNISL